MSAVVQPLKLQVGARTLATIRRRLVRMPFSLDMVLAGVLPPLAALPPSADGYIVTSLPVGLVDEAARRMPGGIVHIVQRYVRYHADLSIGHDAWLAGLSANARATIRRKSRRLAEANDGRIDVRAYSDPAGLAVFHDHARAVSATTYQERLIGEGMPDDAESRRAMAALAAVGRIRAWLLFLGERPVAYLWCSIEGDVVRYDHVGHDPAFAPLSPGAVLQAVAMRDLQAEARFRLFDFTEGEGQHKRQFATGGTPCVDLLILRRTPGNRATVAVLAGFDEVLALGKRLAVHPRLAALAKRVRR